MTTQNLLAKIAEIFPSCNVEHAITLDFGIATFDFIGHEDEIIYRDVYGNYITSEEYDSLIRSMDVYIVKHPNIPDLEFKVCYVESMDIIFRIVFNFGFLFPDSNISDAEVRKLMEKFGFEQSESEDAYNGFIYENVMFCQGAYSIDQLSIEFLEELARTYLENSSDKEEYPWYAHEPAQIALEWLSTKN
jgi:hypothetical protein